MNKVGTVVPVLPTALVATVFEEQKGEPLTELALKAKCYQLMEELEAGGAHIHIPRMDRDYAIGAGLRMLTLRNLVREEEGQYVPERRDKTLISYYANSIRQLRYSIR